MIIARVFTSSFILPPSSLAFAFVCAWLCLCVSVAAAGAPSRDVRAAGAAGDGVADDQAAVQRSVDAASGGTVVFPAGTYRVGTITLKSDVTLDLAAGATLIGHLRAIDCSNVALVGRDRKTSLVRGHIQVQNCRGVRMRDFNQEGFGGQGYVNCSDVTLGGVTIRQAPQRYGGGSAIWFVSCTNVLASDCDFSSNDDVFCLKRSGENIHLRDSVLTGHLAAPFKIGTETDGPFRNISMTGCTIRDSDRGAISIESVDGSQIDGVFISDIRMENVAAPLFIRLGCRDRYGRGLVGAVRNISLHAIDAACKSKDDGIGSSIVGLPGHPVENVTITRFRVSVQGGGTRDDAARRPKELRSLYPEYDMFGTLPAYGLFLRHGSGVTLRDVSIDCVRPDLRPALVAEDVDGLVLDHVACAAAPGAEAALRFEQVRRALVRGATAPSAGPWLRLSGDRSDAVTLLGSGTPSTAQPPVVLGGDFRGALRIEPLAAPRVDEFRVDPVQPGTPVAVSARATNTGPAGYASFELWAGDTLADRRWLWLGAGESRDLSLSGPAFYEPAEHVLRLNAVVRAIRVPPSPGRFVCERLEVPSTGGAGQWLRADVVMRNAGGEPRTETVRLFDRETEIAAEEIALRPGEARGVALRFRLEAAGLHVLTVSGRQGRVAVNPAWIDADRNGRQDAGERSFATIAEALAAAAPGDSIRVQPGRHAFEPDQLPLLIEKPGVSLASAAGADETILEARGAADDRGRKHSVVYVAADDVTLDGLTIRGGVYDVFVDGAANAVIKNCALDTSKRYNLGLAHARGAKIQNNRSSLSGIGFLGMFGGGGSVIEGNRMEDDPAGLRVIRSADNQIRDNVLAAPLWYGMRIERSHRNTIENNRIAGSRLCGIEMLRSDANRVTGNAILDCKTEGILVTQPSNDNRFEPNRFAGNRRGDVVEEIRRAAGADRAEDEGSEAYSGGVDLRTPVRTRQPVPEGR
jgi:parallel beta-helix repeat protein